LRYDLLIAAAIMTSATAHSAPVTSWRSVTVQDTVGCERAAVAAVTTWLSAIGTGDTGAVRRSVARRFAWISAGRNGWSEPTFRAKNFAELFAYVRRRSARHERIANVSIPAGGWHDGRLMLGIVSYTRTADDVAGVQHWLAKGEYECGAGIYVFSAAPQDNPGRDR
jgi:hypothetical protein